MDITDNQAQIDSALKDLETFRLERIAVIDKERAKVEDATSTGCAILLIVSIVFIIIAIYFSIGIANFLIGIVFMFIVLGFVVSPQSYSPNPKYFQTYYRTAMATLVEKLYPSIECISDWYRFEKKVESSLLLFNGLDGKNHMRGVTKNGYHFEFAEVESIYERQTKFKGFFFMFESPVVFCEQIIIREGFVSSIPSYLAGSEIYSLNGAYPAFEKKYEIFTKNKSEAGKILSPDFLKPIYEEFSNSNDEIRWSFIGSHIYLAIESKEGLLDLKLYDSVLPPAFIESFKANIATFVHIAEQISLQLEAIPEELKLEFKRAKNNEGNLDNAAYDHLIDNSED